MSRDKHNENAVTGFVSYLAYSGVDYLVILFSY
jgi:hypothetical protein